MLTLNLGRNCHQTENLVQSINMKDFVRSLMKSSRQFPTTHYPPKKIKVQKTKIPAPWWNDKCAEASERCSTLCRIYKANPTLDNWKAYKRGNAQCQKVLRREKKAGWRNLCASFNYKTPMTEIWRFVKAYKAKTLAPESPDLNSESLKVIQDSTLNKLCPPSCLYLPYSSLETLMREDRLFPSPYGWATPSFLRN